MFTHSQISHSEFCLSYILMFASHAIQAVDIVGSFARCIPLGGVGSGFVCDNASRIKSCTVSTVPTLAHNICGWWSLLLGLSNLSLDSLHALKRECLRSSGFLRPVTKDLLYRVCVLCDAPKVLLLLGLSLWRKGEKWWPGFVSQRGAMCA